MLGRIVLDVFFSCPLGLFLGPPWLPRSSHSLLSFIINHIISSQDKSKSKGKDLGHWMPFAKQMASSAPNKKFSSMGQGWKTPEGLGFCIEALVACTEALGDCIAALGLCIEALGFCIKGPGLLH